MMAGSQLSAFAVMIGVCIAVACIGAFGSCHAGVCVGETAVAMTGLFVRDSSVRTACAVTVGTAATMIGVTDGGTTVLQLCWDAPFQQLNCLPTLALKIYRMR